MSNCFTLENNNNVSVRLNLPETATSSMVLDINKLVDGDDSKTYKVKDPINDTDAVNKRFLENITNNFVPTNSYTKSETDAKISSAIESDKTIGVDGQVEYFKNGDKEASWLIYEGNFVDNDDDLNVALNSGISAQTVFNTWGRFSHASNTENQPANASETQTWSYNASNQTIQTSINSATHIGFYSNTQYDKYEAEVTLTSTSVDDDRMGIVIAFHIDSNGREHTLTALRNNEGGNTWFIAYNYLRTDQVLIANKTSAIPDGGTWNTYPNGTKIKIIRDGDIITAVTTKNNSTTYEPASTITFNLNDYPVLTKFRGPQFYGYSCQSQAQTTFGKLKFKVNGLQAAETYVIDIVNDKVYLPNSDGTYTLDNTKSIFDEIGPGHIIRDKTCGGVWYINNSNEISKINVDGAAFTNVYTKAEINAIKNDYYTKTEVDSLTSVTSGTVVASAKVNADGTIAYSNGVSSVTVLGTGSFRITLSQNFGNLVPTVNVPYTGYMPTVHIQAVTTNSVDISIQRWICGDCGNAAVSLDFYINIVSV